MLYKNLCQKGLIFCLLYMKLRKQTMLPSVKFSRKHNGIIDALTYVVYVRHAFGDRCAFYEKEP